MGERFGVFTGRGGRCFGASGGYFEGTWAEAREFAERWSGAGRTLHVRSVDADQKVQVAEPERAKAPAPALDVSQLARALFESDDAVIAFVTAKSERPDNYDATMERAWANNALDMRTVCATRAFRISALLARKAVQ